MTSEPNPQTIPLTVPQQARLLVDCLPFVFFAVMAGAYVTVLRTVFGGTKPALLAFLAVVLLVTGYRAVQRVRDVASGVAQVREDLLQNILGRGTQRGGRSHRIGQFAQLGRLRLTSKAFHPAMRGRRHRVTYSPASRIVWRLEAMHESDRY